MVRESAIGLPIQRAPIGRLAKGFVTSRPGILRLELAKESYERAGLVGKATRDGGRKHIKTRYGTRSEKASQHNMNTEI